MPDKLPPKILVVEPDEVLNSSLCNVIERYWFNVTSAKNSDAALRYAAVDSPNLAIISSKTQGYKAIELATKLGETQKIQYFPVIFLVDPGEYSEHYVTNPILCSGILEKPILPDKLMITIRELLRKSKPVFHDKILRYNDISMDLATFKVYRSGKELHFGPTEFKILRLFMQKPKNIYSRSQIIDYVWGVDKKISPRTIDVHINRIRTLLTLENDPYQLIKTIRSAGYRLD